MPDITLTLSEAEALVTKALIANRTRVDNARITARALVAAESDGQKGHGLSRVPVYALQARVGKVDGFAIPQLTFPKLAAVRIDGGYGFAYPAIDTAISALSERARHYGIAVAAIHRSHHFGQAGAHAERLANHGFVAIALGNSPKAMAFWGGRKPMMGTNPIAFSCPTPQESPLVIDLALSVAARAKIVAAEKEKRAIPGDWALDQDGNATTDPSVALAGSLLPIGGVKGSALALMVEIMCAALTGSHFGWEANSVLNADGDPPNLGHVLIAIDPGATSEGSFFSRISSLLTTVAAEPEVRLPGLRRLEARARAAEHGLVIPASLYREISTLSENQG